MNHAHKRKYMLDTATGKCTDISKQLAAAIGADEADGPTILPSPDGKHIALVNSGKERTDPDTIWLFTVASGKARKLATAARVRTMWGGTRLFMTCISSERAIEPFRMFDTAGGTLVTSKICGLVTSADAAGKTVVCMYDPKNPGKPQSPTEFRANATIGLISLDSGKQIDIGPLAKLRTAPVISPGGQYVAGWTFGAGGAFGARQGEETPKGPKASVHVLKVGETKVRMIPGATWPRFVSDTGMVVAQPDGGRAAQEIVTVWDEKGQARTLAKGVRSATVAGNMVYYITKDSILKAVPIEAGK